MLNVYKVKIKTLGPVHIGDGTKIQKSEYIRDNKDGRIYVMDTYKMFSALNRLGLADKYERFVIEERSPILYNFIRDNNIRPEEYRKWAKYSYNAIANADPKSEVQSCIKDVYGMPYIPGSSFKGALTNAILNMSLLKKERMQTSKAVEIAEFNGRKRYLSNEANKMQVGIFHKLREGNKEKDIGNAVNSRMRGIILSDSTPVSIEELVLCQKVDVKCDGKENKLPILRECIRPGVTLELNITIDTDVLNLDEKKLENAIKIMYNNIQKKFLAYFPTVQKTSETALYLGGGTGYIQKTALYSLIHDQERAAKTASKIHNYLAPKHKHSKDFEKYGVSPTTRKCTIIGNKRYDMGLCAIEFEPIP